MLKHNVQFDTFLNLASINKQKALINNDFNKALFYNLLIPTGMRHL